MNCNEKCITIKVCDGDFFNEFDFANNQSTPADVAGFLVDKNLNRVFKADYSIVRRYTSGWIPGNEDVTFADRFLNGTFNQGFASSTRPFAKQSTGKMIFGSSFTSFAGVTANRIIRINTDWSVDSSFIIGTGFDNTVLCLSVQSDDKIICGGTFTNYNGVSRNRLTRLNADGTEDSAFVANLGTGFNSQVSFAQVLSTGKILVVGAFTAFNGNTRNRAVRLNADGTEDTTFATNIGTGFNAQPLACSEDSTGKLYIMGTFTTFKGNARVKIVRLNADGTEDTAFYTNLGTSVAGPGSTIFIGQVVEQSSGKLICSGFFTSFNGNARGSIFRLNADGTEDTTFASNNGTGANGNIFHDNVKIDGSGDIYVSGSFQSWNGNGKPCLVKLNSDGLEYSAFSSGLGTSFGPGNVTSINILSDRLLVLGNLSTFNGRTVTGNMIEIVLVTTDSEVITEGTLIGRFIGNGLNYWLLRNVLSGFADPTGINLTINPAGQLQYTSTNIPGTKIDDYLRYALQKL